jgi:hypothetical protein
MSDTTYRATVVEVFPMRLGGEILLDVTLEVPDEAEFPDPKPNDEILVGGNEVKIWAAPKISHPKGARRVNVQFQQDEIGSVSLEEGMQVELRPRG